MANLQINQQPSSSTPPSGFTSTFGLHPMTSILALAIDSMVFSTELAGFGLLLSVPVALAVWNLAYRAQMRFYGDDVEAAKIKASMLALLVAIPSPFPACLYLPAGFIGMFRKRS